MILLKKDMYGNEVSRTMLHISIRKVDVNH